MTQLSDFGSRALLPIEPNEHKLITKSAGLGDKMNTSDTEIGSVYDQ